MKIDPTDADIEGKEIDEAYFATGSRQNRPVDPQSETKSVGQSITKTGADKVEGYDTAIKETIQIDADFERFGDTETLDFGD